MNRKKILITFFIIIINTLLVFAFSYLFINHKYELVTTYISKLNLKERTKIEEEYIEEIKVPKIYINENTYTNKDDIVGKYVKLDNCICSNSLFYINALESEEEMNDFLHIKLNNDESTYDLLIKDIKVNPSHLNKGMKVNIYVTINRKEVLSDLLIENAEISGLYDHANKEIKDNQNISSLGYISLKVKDYMIPYINKAIVLGEVNLVVSANPYSNLEVRLNKEGEVFNLLK